MASYGPVTHDGPLPRTGGLGARPCAAFRLAGYDSSTRPATEAASCWAGRRMIIRGVPFDFPFDFPADYACRIGLDPEDIDSLFDAQHLINVVPEVWFKLANTKSRSWVRQIVEFKSLQSLVQSSASSHTI